MVSTATLLVGVIAAVSVCGVGRLLIKPLGSLPAHWYVALAMLAGQAASSLLVQLASMAGRGIVPLHACAAAILVLGAIGHVTSRRSWLVTARPRKSPVLAVALPILLVSFALLALTSLAPSTKIDELYYHMLVGRRIVEDHGLRIYQLPFEQAIVPQMGYQVFEAVFHAIHAMDAGNVLSLTFFTALVFLIYGVVAEESGSTDAGLIAATAASSGVFPAVWDVTAGPHALGELGTFTAVAALFFPGRLSAKDPGHPHVWCDSRPFAAVLGAAVAASTKISLLPLSLALTAIAIVRSPANRRLKLALIAAAIWSLVLGPLIVWTYLHTKAPLGAAFAEWFPGSTYQSTVLNQIADTRAYSQIQNPFPYIAQALNGLSIILMLSGAIWCLRHSQRYGLLACLVVVQIALIVLLLPYEFRFLGGLQYGLLAAGAIALPASWRAPLRQRWLAGTALLLTVPWLAAEIVYAWPLAKVSLGMTSRAAFEDRYVAFHRDFEVLDRILPRDAVLYANERPPAVYSPRPMIFDLADWNGSSPVFKFIVGSYPDPPEYVARQHSLNLVCGEVVYSNPSATAVTYRTPGHASELYPLVVVRCTRGLPS